MRIDLKRASITVGLIISTTVLIDMGIKVDSHYAKAARLTLVELRLEQKILSDKADNLQDRIWKLEDRYRGDISKMPITVKEEYRLLKIKLQQIRERLSLV